MAPAKCSAWNRIEPGALLVASILVAWPLDQKTQRKSTIAFTDATNASGLDFVLKNNQTDKRYLPETMAGGIAAFDFDGDGRLDLFFANGAELPGLAKTGPSFWNRLYRNEGQGRFTDVTRDSGLAGVGYSIGAAAGDFDNDGRV